mgnify:CR=1 FL=1
MWLDLNDDLHLCYYVGGRLAMSSMCGVSGVGIGRRLQEAKTADLAADTIASPTAQTASLSSRAEEFGKGSG